MSLKKMFSDPHIGEYSVSRKANARKITLSIAKNGVPNVTIPKYAPYSAGRAFILRQKNWVMEHKEDSVVLQVGSTYELYDGTKVSISVSGARNSTRKNVGAIDIGLKAETETAYANKVIENFLKTDTENVVSGRVEHYSSLIGLRPASVRYRATTSRWGSCNSRHQLTFSAYTAQLPVELIDYIVIHEICHIRNMNHSKAFWDLVALFDRDFKSHRQQLKDHQLRPIIKVV